MEGRDLIVMARRRAGLSQQQLADRLGRPQPTVARWERGTQRPSFETVAEVIAACGLELASTLARADDSYDALIDAQLMMETSERIRRLAPASFDAAAIASVLAAHDVRYVLIDTVAGAAHGWPITLDAREYTITPAPGPRNAARLARALGALGAGPGALDDPYAGLDTHERHPLAGDVTLVVSARPAGTHGYRDLLRDATPLDLADVRVDVASLLDLLRMADASPRRLRAFAPALKVTLARTRRREAGARDTRTPKRSSPDGNERAARPRPRGDPGHAGAPRGPLRAHRWRRRPDPRLARPHPGHRRHARPVATKPRAPGRRAHRARRALRVDPERYPHGYAPPGGLDARTFTNMVSVALTTRHGHLDVALYPDGTRGYEDLIRAATRETVPGTTVVAPVAAAADIERSKLAAGREKDQRQLPAMREDFDRHDPAWKTSRRGPSPDVGSDH